VVRVVPGHGPAVMPWPQAAQPELRYLNRLKADVLTAIKSGKTLAQASASAGVSEKDAWELFDEFNARNVAAAFAEMEWE
jgi:molybdenum-dependent DNA-binding transcriptional regulator ModE